MINRLILSAVVLSAFASPAFAAPHCADGSASILAVDHWAATKAGDGALEVSLSIRNGSIKGIHAVIGAVSFFDKAGVELGSVGVDEDIRLKLAAVHEQIVVHPANGLSNLLDASTDEVAALACVTMVMYSDGTRAAF
jgi:hypothetical protein